MGKKNPHVLLMESLWETIYKFLKKLEMIQKFHFSVFIQRKQKHPFKKIYDPNGHCCIIYNSQDVKETSVSIDT